MSRDITAKTPRMPRVTAARFDIPAALEKRYSRERGWAVFYEMSPAGWAKRRADAMAFCLWPSRGLEIHGFEFKSSRSDWLAEVKNPRKAEESVFCYCDRWFVVTSRNDIVHDGELPPSWGLLEPRGKGLVTKVKAPPLEPKPVDRHMLARVLHRATQQPEPAEIQAKIEAAREEERECVEQDHERGLRDAQHAAASAEDRLRKAQEEFARFQAIAGVNLGWNNPDLHRLAKAAGRLQQDEYAVEHVRSEMQHWAQRAEGAAHFLRRVLARAEEKKGGEG